MALSCGNLTNEKAAAFYSLWTAEKCAKQSIDFVIGFMHRCAHVSS